MELLGKKLFIFVWGIVGIKCDGIEGVIGWVILLIVIGFGFLLFDSLDWNL